MSSEPRNPAGDPTTGAERLVAELVALGVEVAFGLPGVHNLAIWKAIAGSPIRLVAVRHEQAAVYAADGYNRATGSLGVALVTTGPGAANTAGAMGEAQASGSAVLLIATDIPAALRRPDVNRGVLHETADQGAIFAPIAKAARTVGAAEEIGPAVAEAALAALAAPAGPVYLGIPTDFLGQAAPGAATLDPALAAVPAAADLQAARELIDAAERILIWAGGGAVRSGASAEAGVLAERLCAPVVTTYGGRGLLPREHPCAVPGPVQAEPVGRLWDEADLVIALGSDFDGMMTQNWRMPAPDRLLAVNVDERDAGKNYRPDLTLVGDVAPTLAALLPSIAPRAGIDALRERLDGIAAKLGAEIAADDPGAAALIDAFEAALPEDSIVVADMCIPGYWLAGYRRVPLPRKLAYPVGWGTLGFAFPAALGAAVAGAGPTVCVCGDGGFLFACGELASAAEAELPLTIVLVDDGGYGMLRFDQLAAGDSPFGVDLVRPDFAALAAAFGIEATKLSGFGPEFERALAAAVAGGAPSMLVVDAALKPPPTTSPRWYRPKPNVS